VFTLILVVITLAGSLWVMYHLDNNMMAGHEVARSL
jgi:cytochrome o ubiquinol oxidase operon protein cyoD